jgi:hypothetical protein
MQILCAFLNTVFEVNAGRIAGPFCYHPISNLRVSPIRLVPKKTGGIRLTTNLSSPINGSVNYLSIMYQLLILNPSKSNSPWYIGNNLNTDFMCIFEHCVLKPSLVCSELGVPIADDKTER